MRKIVKIQILFVGLGLAFVGTTMAVMQSQSGDPDRPAGLQEPFDEGEYIRQREEFIARLRGFDPDKPFDPTARTRAIALMDNQMAQLRQAALRSLGTQSPLVFPNWVELGPNPIPNGQTTPTNPVTGRVS